MRLRATVVVAVGAVVATDINKRAASLRAEPAQSGDDSIAPPAGLALPFYPRRQDGRTLNGARGASEVSEWPLTCRRPACRCFGARSLPCEGPSVLFAGGAEEATG